MTPDHSALIERLELHAKDANTLELHGLADHITQAAAALRDLTEWRDISTAPKDGTVILLCTGHGVRVIGFWFNGSWDDGDFCCFDSADVKCWLPLPSAPNQAKVLK